MFAVSDAAVVTAVYVLVVEVICCRDVSLMALPTRVVVTRWRTAITLSVDQT